MPISKTFEWGLAKFIIFRNSINSIQKSPGEIENIDTANSQSLQCHYSISNIICLMNDFPKTSLLQITERQQQIGTLRSKGQ